MTGMALLLGYFLQGGGARCELTSVLYTYTTRRPRSGIG